MAKITADLCENREIHKKKSRRALTVKNRDMVPTIEAHYCRPLSRLIWSSPPIFMRQSKKKSGKAGAANSGASPPPNIY